MTAEAAKATVDAEEKMVTCFGYKCPLASQCKKGAKCTKTCSSQEDAEWNILQHLEKSPYHQLSPDEAREAFAGCECEMWEEAAKTAQKKVEEEESWQPKWAARGRSSGHLSTATGSGGGRRSRSRRQGRRSRSRQARSAAGGSAGPRQPRTPPEHVVARRNRSGHDLMELGGQTVPETITLGYQQYLACCDSLRRAQYAAEASQALCQKAARAFEDEAICIRRCSEIFDSYRL